MHTSMKKAETSKRGGLIHFTSSAEPILLISCDIENITVHGRNMIYFGLNETDGSESAERV
jgi:hypothetical protein